MVIVDRWSLFRGGFVLFKKMGLQVGGRCRQVVAVRRWSLAQVFMNYYYFFNFFQNQKRKKIIYSAAAILLLFAVTVFIIWMAS
jgi:hypothetical protein